MTQPADLKSEVYRDYQNWASISGQLINEAREVFPGGDTRMSAHFAPYPVFIERAAGARLHDADGHEIIDFMNNFTSLVHGHANQAVVSAVNEQMARGSAYAAPTGSQVELGALIRERIPSIEQLRFTSSGTEATLMGLRAARAFTGRQKIMKMEGGYHGSYELAEVSLVPLPNIRGPLEAPVSLPVDASFPDSVLADTIVCPFNQPELARNLIRKHGHELAAVIAEPVLGSMGMVPASREFLETLRAETRAAGIVFILDEVITLRTELGGAQSYYGVTPDLTAMGKIIGGGLPIGAIGGSEEIMRVFHPDQPQPVMHASTFSGNPLSMVAGAAAMHQLNPQNIDHINTLGEHFRSGVSQTFAAHGIRGQATGLGSLSNIHLNDQPINDARDSIDGIIAAGQIGSLLHLKMLQRGVASASRLMYCTSTAMQASDVDYAIAALDEVLREMKPGIERECPALLT